MEYQIHDPENIHVWLYHESISFKRKILGQLTNKKLSCKVYQLFQIVPAISSYS